MYFIRALVIQNPLRLSKKFTLGLTRSMEKFRAKSLRKLLAKVIRVGIRPLP